MNMQTGNPDEEEPTEEEIQQAWDHGIKIGSVMFGGKAGVPLSEETKKKISLALSKGKGKKKGAGKKGKNPEVAKRQKQISEIQKKVKEFNTQIRRELLEMKIKGTKLSPEESARKQLDVLNRKEEFSNQIGKLKAEIDQEKSKEPAPAKASDRERIGKTLDRLNKLADEHEHKS